MSNSIIIRRVLAAAAVLTALSIGAAQANDTAHFRDLKPGGHARSTSEKFADGAACGATGATHTIRVTMPVFEKCMRAKGWVLDHYSPDPSQPVRGTVENYTDTKGDTEGHPRGTAALHADRQACKEHRRAGESVKQCLAGLGWELIYTQHGPAPQRRARYARTQPEPTWIDPDTGLTCHNTGFATVCSNF